jgi:hypothetical protein
MAHGGLEMTLAILHLSDMHLRDGTEPVLTRASAIQAALRTHISSHTAVLIIISGDIAFSGTPAEYKIATGFAEDLLEKIRTIPSVTLLGTVIVPGNHDCNFSVEGDARPALMNLVAEKLDGYDLGGESIQQLLRVQQDFFEFEKTISNSEKSQQAKLFWHFAFAYNGRRVSVAALNTALFSKLKELPGQLYFPLTALEDREESSDYAVTVFHHPYTWLEPNNSRNLRRRVESNSDLILTGHEHDGDSFIKIDRQGEETGYVEGAALQATGDTGFNVALVDFETNTNQIYRYVWSDGLYRPEPAKAYIFTRKQSLVRDHFENNAEFLRKLHDLGTGFMHPRKKDLTLRDMFIYPDMKLASVSAKSQNSLPSSAVFEYMLEENYVQIAGAPTSGKSTLARALYIDFQRQARLLPILLSGLDLKGPSHGQFEKNVEKAFAEQFRSAQWERFRQQPSERKVLIMDDWHRCRLPKKAKKQLLDAARTMFGKVILISADVSLFQLLTESAQDKDGAAHAEFCEIKQFGYRLRSELINRWHRLGADLDDDDLTLTSRISASENVIDTLVRKGIVPSWPVFILSVLQTTSTTVEETAAYGSYGHLYEALLTKRMAITSKRPNSLGMKFTYLSTVAYELFKSGRSALTENDLRRIHRSYEHDYQISVNEPELWEELTAAQILERTGDEYAFQYKYAYYFFVAKYFQQGISNVREASALRETLIEMVRCVHDEEYSNILIFYLYLTKDRELLDQMLSVAGRIFVDKPAADLATDIDFVNQLRYKAPEIYMKREDIEKNREERRSRMDQSEETTEPSQQAMVKTEYKDDISDQLKIEFAFKSLQVMGQVLKNFPLDLKGDLKLNLTLSSYLLTLRTLRVFLCGIETNIEALLRLLEGSFRTFEPFAKKTEGELRDAAGATIVRLTEMSIFGMIKKLSLAVGVVDLSETYESVRRALGEDNVPARLIDLSIRLDHFGRIPEEDVKALATKLENNMTAYTILRFLIAEYLHLFPCDYKIEQRMVQLFKFRPHVLNLGDKRIKKQLA